jgi:predicted RNA-binding Zn ribbon-like protein
MVFTHDTELSLRVAVSLVNSGDDPDTLTTVEDLDDWYAEYQFTGRHDSDAAELSEVRALRPVLRRLLTGERDEAVQLVNDILADARALPQLVRHGEFDWHLHAVTPEQPLAARIAVEVAMAMIDVIRVDEMSRLGTCADDDCDGLVLDLSRNRSRRFCSTACGNRNAVTAYRSRQASLG